MACARGTLRGGTPLLSWNRLIADAGLRLASFSGAAHISAWLNGGAGVIVKFERVKPPRGGSFQPLRAKEISPEFLDKAIGALKRWNYEFVSIDEVPNRARQDASNRRFVCLTFEGGYRDFNTYAYPVLSQHRVPFALYIPTGFIDGLGEAWWLALEDIIARNRRMGAIIDGVERRFAIGTTEEKHQVYTLMSDWLRSLSPSDMSLTIADLCTRYGADLKAAASDLSMTWPDLAKIARDPQATIGSATMHYSVLAPADSATALREMKMGRSVLETALGTECRHFAYPFGDGASFGAREILFAKQAGFTTAVSARPGMVDARTKSELLALPRIAWDGRRRSMGALRAIFSGIALPRDRNNAAMEST